MRALHVNDGEEDVHFSCSLSWDLGDGWGQIWFDVQAYSTPILRVEVDLNSERLYYTVNEGDEPATLAEVRKLFLALMIWLGGESIL